LNNARDTLYTLIERYTVSAAPDSADSASHKLILRIVQPYSNHNGGLVMFGPDGMLYIGMATGAPGRSAEPRAEPDSLLGKLLRIDVDGATRMPVRRTTLTSDARGETRSGPSACATLAFRVRRGAGLLYIADVGQNLWKK